MYYNFRPQKIEPDQQGGYVIPIFACDRSTAIDVCPFAAFGRNYAETRRNAALLTKALEKTYEQDKPEAG